MTIDPDYKARHTGKVHVLLPYAADRDTIPYRPNTATLLLQRLDATYGFTEPDVRAFLDEHPDPEETRAWLRLAWAGLAPARRTDTWDRVFAVLRASGHHGATGAEIARATGLGHGAVSSALSTWVQAGSAVRLRGGAK